MTYSILSMTPSQKPILTLMSSIKNVRAGGLDISPDYQRQYIWSNEYKDQLILSLILNYPIGNVVINELDDPNDHNARQEVVDGKQRLTTILKFVEGGQVGDNIIETSDNWFKLSRKVSDQVKKIIEKAFAGYDPEGLDRMKRVKRLSFSDLPQSTQDSITTYNVPVYTMHSADPAQIRDYFKVLQNQEKLRAGEIISALPKSPLSSYYRQLNTIGFLEKIHFKDSNRNDLEKIYCSMLGMWFGKVHINSANKETISFVESLDEVLSNEQLGYVNAIGKGITDIANMPAILSHMRVTTRTIELLLGLALFEPGYFSTNTLSKVEYVCSTSYKLAAFRSSESEDVAFSKYFTDEYVLNKQTFISNRAPLYRRLFNISTMSTSKADFIRVIEELRDDCNSKCQ